MKYCYKCQTIKENTDFYRDQSRGDKLSNICKSCCHERNKKYTSEHRLQILEKSKAYYEKNKEKNKKCKSEYDKRYYQENKELIHNRYENNKENKKKYNKKYNIENKDCIAKQKKEYKNNNREQFRKSRAKSRRKRYKHDITFRLRDIISSQICRSLKLNNSNKKGKSILRYLPYTIEELKKHLEQQFELWMNWGNYGKFEKDKIKWNIDHIIPQSSLPYNCMDHPNFKKCWSLENLRPLEIIENVKKGNK